MLSSWERTLRYSSYAPGPFQPRGRQMRWPTKPSAAVLEFGVDLSDELLAVNDTIPATETAVTASVVALPRSDGTAPLAGQDLAVLSAVESEAAGVVVVLLASGQPGFGYDVTLAVSTVNSRVYELTCRIYIDPTQPYTPPPASADQVGGQPIDIGGQPVVTE